MLGTVKRTAAFIAIIGSLTIGGNAIAQDAANPEVYQKVIDCRAIDDAQARLACYDASVKALDEATKADDLVVMSRESVKEAKRGLFGFSLPKINLFGNDDDEQDEIKRIDAKIASFSQGQSGWIIKLEDGAIWHQTDSIYVSRPKVGESIVIEKAALGSYKAKIDGGVAFRIKRRD